MNVKATSPTEEFLDFKAAEIKHSHILSNILFFHFRAVLEK